MITACTKSHQKQSDVKKLFESIEFPVQVNEMDKQKALHRLSVAMVLKEKLRLKRLITDPNLIKKMAGSKTPGPLVKIIFTNNAPAQTKLANKCKPENNLSKLYLSMGYSALEIFNELAYCLEWFFDSSPPSNSANTHDSFIPKSQYKIGIKHIDIRRINDKWNLKDINSLTKETERLDRFLSTIPIGKIIKDTSLQKVVLIFKEDLLTFSPDGVLEIPINIPLDVLKLYLSQSHSLSISFEPMELNNLLIKGALSINNDPLTKRYNWMKSGLQKIRSVITSKPLSPLSPLHQWLRTTQIVIGHKYYPPMMEVAANKPILHIPYNIGKNQLIFLIKALKGHTGRNIIINALTSNSQQEKDWLTLEKALLVFIPLLRSTDTAIEKFSYPWSLDQTLKGNESRIYVIGDKTVLPKFYYRKTTKGGHGLHIEVPINISHYSLKRFIRLRAQGYNVIYQKVLTPSSNRRTMLVPNIQNKHFYTGLWSLEKALKQLPLKIRQDLQKHITFEIGSNKSLPILSNKQNKHPSFFQKYNIISFPCLISKEDLIAFIRVHHAGYRVELPLEKTIRAVDYYKALNSIFHLVKHMEVKGQKGLLSKFRKKYRFFVPSRKKSKINSPRQYVLQIPADIDYTKLIMYVAKDLDQR